jgi:hypothetical protein
LQATSKPESFALISEKSSMILGLQFCSKWVVAQNLCQRSSLEIKVLGGFHPWVILDKTLMIAITQSWVGRF